MVKDATKIETLWTAMQERAKELNCLYRVEELLKNYDEDLETIFRQVIEALPSGWQYSNYCRARIIYLEKIYQPRDMKVTDWYISANIAIQDRRVGVIEVYYTHDLPEEDVGPFLKDEVKLVETIAQRLSDFILHQNLRHVIDGLNSGGTKTAEDLTRKWRIVLDIARRMDHDLFLRMTRKMLNYLCWSGVAEANSLLRQISSDRITEAEDLSEGSNRPQQMKRQIDIQSVSNEIYEIADRHLSDDEILSCIEKWMQEDRASFLSKTLVNLNSTLGDIADALRRFIHLVPEGIQLSESTLKGMRVALIRQILSDQLNFIKIAKNHLEIEDFYALMKRMIYPMAGHGQVGGKTAGLFLAWHILEKQRDEDDDLKDIKIPQTWCITSDGLHNFMNYNNLEEVTEQKYKDIGQVRQEYPHIIQLFKNSRFTPEIIQGLSMALDDLGDKPIIVRSSSLLEDRFGAAFSGKYKSLFLANQGSKKERLKAFIDAIAEVYSSTFGPDPIEYRAERGLIDFKEEMGIIIQEVVGTKVGKYFFPAFAGVAFSNNEFRWSPRIKREDGLIRMVPGLGTRAVDRLSDDYTILVAPGQPNLRVNVSFDEIIRYSPNKMDVINLETNSFETVAVKDLLNRFGEEIPNVMNLISTMQDGHLQQPSLVNMDFEHDEMVVTFEGLINNTHFVRRVHKILKILQETLGTPVDVEFASDGNCFYLLQCRPQYFSEEDAPAQIPRDIPSNAILFTAHKHISNGYIPDITHIVYVDPLQYADVEELSTLLEVGRSVSRLNKLLPKRQFILMGPGRWGSRGDIKLGVNVTYSDINNTAALIEIARQKGRYVPDLSFGTHFFQDLVETSIRYIPLYPDEDNNIFNEQFLINSHNILPDIAPEYAHLDKVMRVIDVPRTTGGKVVKIYMNAELDEAIAVISQPTAVAEITARRDRSSKKPQSEDHWRWRLRMVERIAELVDTERFGIVAFYLFGSTKNGTAGPASDIDVLVHFRGDEIQRCSLMQWMEGWSLCLDEMNYLRTGFRSGGLLDLHLVTDEDIEKRSSFAVKIDAVTDAAREIPLNKKLTLTD